MKQFLTILAFSFALLFTGCKTPEQTAYKSLGSIAITVDAATHAYYDYRASHVVDAALDDKIKSAYLEYQKAFAVAEAAERAFKAGGDKTILDNALTAVSAASGDIVGLVNDLTKKAQ